MRQGAYKFLTSKQKIRYLRFKYGNILCFCVEISNFKLQFVITVLVVAKYDSKSNFLYKLQRAFQK